MDMAAAAEERIRELNHAIRFYEERGWDDLGAEYRVRLDEVQRLMPHWRNGHQPLATPLTEGEARAMAGDR